MARLWPIQSSFLLFRIHAVDQLNPPKTFLFSHEHSEETVTKDILKLLF